MTKTNVLHKRALSIIQSIQEITGKPFEELEPALDNRFFIQIWDNVDVLSTVLNNLESKYILGKEVKNVYPR